MNFNNLTQLVNSWGSLPRVRFCGYKHKHKLRVNCAGYSATQYTLEDLHIIFHHWLPFVLGIAFFRTSVLFTRWDFSKNVLLQTCIHTASQLYQKCYCANVHKCRAVTDILPSLFSTSETILLHHGLLSVLDIGNDHITPRVVFCLELPALEIGKRGLCLFL